MGPDLHRPETGRPCPQGQVIINLAPLLRIPTEADIVETANALLDDRSWLRSECLGGLAVAQV